MSVPLSEVSHLLSVPLSEVLLLCNDRKTFRTDILSEVLLYFIIFNWQGDGNVVNRLAQQKPLPKLCRFLPFS